MNDYCIIKHGFIDKNILNAINKKEIDSNYHITPKKDDLYSFILNKNLNLPIENSQQKVHDDYFKNEVIIDLNLSNLNQDILLEMTDSGYLIFYICNIPYHFYIGEKNVLDFIDCFFK